MIDEKNFPHHQSVCSVMLERRGKYSLQAWKNQEWGSHWYNGIRDLLKECKTGREAELLLHYVFSLSESQDPLARQVLENLFTGQHKKYEMK